MNASCKYERVVGLKKVSCCGAEQRDYVTKQLRKATGDEAIAQDQAYSWTCYFSSIPRGSDKYMDLASSPCSTSFRVYLLNRTSAFSDMRVPRILRRTSSNAVRPQLSTASTRDLPAMEIRACATVTCSSYPAKCIITRTAKCRSHCRCDNALLPRFDVEITRHVNTVVLAVPDPRRPSPTNGPNANHTSGPPRRRLVARISSPAAQHTCTRPNRNSAQGTINKQV
jgi:hypothetical protein